MGWIVVAAVLAVLLVNVSAALLVVLAGTRRLVADWQIARRERDEACQVAAVLRDELVVARAKDAGATLAAVDGAPKRGRQFPMAANGRYVGRTVGRPAALSIDDQPVVSDEDWDRFDDWWRQQRHGR